MWWRLSGGFPGLPIAKRESVFSERRAFVRTCAETTWALRRMELAEVTRRSSLHEQRAGGDYALSTGGCLVAAWRRRRRDVTELTIAAASPAQHAETGLKTAVSPASLAAPSMGKPIASEARP
jgi:hypothetical protein